MPKVTFECEVELPADGRIGGVELFVQDECSHWVSRLAFILPRMQRVREGKHLRFNGQSGKVVELGEKLEDEG